MKEQDLTKPSTLLEVLQKICVDEVTGAFVKGSVDGNNIALRNELLQILDAASTNCLGSLCKLSFRF